MFWKTSHIILYVVLEQISRWEYNKILSVHAWSRSRVEEDRNIAFGPTLYVRIEDYVCLCRYLSDTFIRYRDYLFIRIDLKSMLMKTLESHDQRFEHTRYFF